LVGWSGIGYEEAYRVWNMGVGMVLVIPESALDDVIGTLPEAMEIGRLAPRVTGGAGVELV
jgi:phosphoribosylaminoimidazole (AIR) synthetase